MGSPNTHMTGVRNLTHTHILQCSDLSNVPDNLQCIYLIASSYKQINSIQLHCVIYGLTGT